MKLWGGRFSKDTSELVLEYDESVGVGKRMVEEDIRGSMAHAAMLTAQGILSREDGAAIQAGLRGILEDARADRIPWLVENEDIHMTVEKLLTERIGEPGKRLHTGRSRNDQVALDNHMIVLSQCRVTVSLLRALTESLLAAAKKHLGTPMPGYTHLQRAQPVTLAHHLLAYVQMFLRDLKRFTQVYEAADEMPLGSGALAGTTYPLDREKVAALLGFSAVTDNSLDGVSNRDYLIDYISAAALTMMHLSRFCEELVLWNSTEFRFVEMDDAFATGSSIMPQKKNPDIAELIRGKTGRVYGDLTALLTVMKALPLAYNKDMQEDKSAFWDAADTVNQSLAVFTGMFDTLTFRTEVMARSALDGFSNATDCADYLVRAGIPFRDAHRVVGELVAYCLDRGKALTDLRLDELRGFCPAFGEDVYEALSLEKCISARSLRGGPAPAAVADAIAAAEKKLAGLCLPDAAPLPDEL